MLFSLSVRHDVRTSSAAQDNRRAPSTLPRSGRYLAHAFMSLCLGLVPLIPATASAATTPAYLAVSYGMQLTIKPNQTIPVVLTFKNAGSSTWNSQASAYIYGNSSPLHTSSWLEADRAATLAPAGVKPGQSGSASFVIQAPANAGTYTQDFLLGWNESNWVKGSKATITLHVIGNSPPGSSVVSPTQSTSLIPVSNDLGQTTITTTVAAPPSSAQRLSNITASLVSKGGISWQLDNQSHTSVTLSYKNTSQQTWTTSGPNAVYLAVGNSRSSSPFQDPSWSSATLVSTSSAAIPPNTTGRFVLALTSPAQPGAYSEVFELHDASGALIPGSQVTLPIQVNQPAGFIPTGIANGMDPSLMTANQLGTYQAAVVAQSVNSITLTGNARIRISYAVKNTGTSVWNNVYLRMSGLMAASSNINTSMRDQSWADAIDPIKGKNVTAPGQIDAMNFELKVPALHGTYRAQFQLYADGQEVQGGMIDIPVTVTQDGLLQQAPAVPTPTPVSTPTSPATPSTPANSNGTWTPTTPVSTNAGLLPTAVAGAPTPIPLSAPISGLSAEPIIRVGIRQPTTPQLIVQGVNTGFLIVQNGQTVCTFGLGSQATLHYSASNGLYSVSGADCNVQSSNVYQAVAPDGISPLETPEYPRGLSWLPGANDDKFRGKLELNASSPTDVWVINELPIEWYLKGIGETSNSSPGEFQKALLTAARTYAMYLVEHNTKHNKEHYIIDATYDQVYRGYGAEIRDPSVVSAVDATRGQIVTYGGILAITPYYSRSDGRTRSWTEVWGGGPYPWLVSVSVPWDVGKVLWGHGIGMSATGALGAAADGWTYDHILNYFYTNTQLMRIYQ